MSGEVQRGVTYLLDIYAPCERDLLTGITFCLMWMMSFCVRGEIYTDLPKLRAPRSKHDKP